MKLFTTMTSPYGRIARIVVLEKGLQDRVVIEVAQTRQTDSPYYSVNPSGRVPYLLLEDGRGLEDSGLISRYLDTLDGAPSLTVPAAGTDPWDLLRIEAMARSMLDGIALWGREFSYRAPEERSQTIIAHEAARAERMLDGLMELLDHPVLAGSVNVAQITLGCALHGRDNRPAGFDWRAGRPALAAWIDSLGQRSSFAATLPPPSS